MSFNIDLISDLHHEWWEKDGQPFNYAASKKNDIVIVAGDLATDTKQSVEELRKIAAVYKTVIFIDGNHEFRTTPGYGYNFDFDAVEQILRDGIASIPNAVYLRDTPFIKDGVAIIGRNCHWDYELVKGDKNVAIEQATKPLQGDFNQAASFSKLARRDYYALRNQITALSANDSITEIVVVTHTVPRAELLENNPNYAWHHQSRMGAGVMRNLLQYDAGKKVKFWLYGHQHTNPVRTAVIDGVTYHHNPRGMPAEKAGKAYEPSQFTFPSKP